MPIHGPLLKQPRDFQSTIFIFRQSFIRRNFCGKNFYVSLLPPFFSACSFCKGTGRLTRGGYYESVPVFPPIHWEAFGNNNPAVSTWYFLSFVQLDPILPLPPSYFLCFTSSYKGFLPIWEFDE